MSCVELPNPTRLQLYIMDHKCIHNAHMHQVIMRAEEGNQNITIFVAFVVE